MTEFLAGPPDDLRKYLGILPVILRRLKQSQGNHFCSDFAVRGYPALLSINTDDELTRLLDSMSATAITGAVEGKRSPRSFSKPTDEDRVKLERALIERGLRVEARSLIANQKSDDPRYCESLAMYIETVASLSGEAGDRLSREALVAYIAVAPKP